MRKTEINKVTERILKNSGLLFWRASDTSTKLQMIGFPDWAGVTPRGQFWALITKSEKEKLTNDQTEWLNKMNDNHTILGVCRTVEQILTFVETCGGKVPRIM